MDNDSGQPQIAIGRVPQIALRWTHARTLGRRRHQPSVVSRVQLNRCLDSAPPDYSFRHLPFSYDPYRATGSGGRQALSMTCAVQCPVKRRWRELEQLILFAECQCTVGWMVVSSCCKSWWSVSRDGGSAGHTAAPPAGRPAGLTVDAVEDDVNASLPRLLVKAAAQLCR